MAPEVLLYGEESKEVMIDALYYNAATAEYFWKMNWMITFSCPLDLVRPRLSSPGANKTRHGS